MDRIFTTDRIQECARVRQASGGQVPSKHYTHGPLGVLIAECRNAECIKTSIITQIVPAQHTADSIKFLRWYNLLAGELYPNGFFILLLGLIENTRR